MSANAVKFAIRDSVQAVFALYRSSGLGACQDHDFLPNAQAGAAECFADGSEIGSRLTPDERANETASYVLAYTTSAEYVVAGLPSLN